MRLIRNDALVHDASTYTNWGCRCDECRADHSAKIAKRRAERKRELEADPSLAEHGTASTYQNWGCRCMECTDAQTTERKRWTKRD